MSDTEKLLDDTLERLESLFKESKVSSQEAQSIIKRCFKVAFKQADRYFIDVNDFQRKLSKELSPEHLKISHKELYNYLVSINEIEMPSDLLAQFKARSFFNYILQSPKVGMNSIRNYLLEKVEPMVSNINRYPFPIRPIVNLVNLGVDIGLYLTTSALVLPLYGVRIAYNLLKTVNTGILNVLTGDAYDKKLEQHTNHNDLTSEEAKKEFIDNVRAQYQNTFEGLMARINDLNDDELFNSVVEARYEKIYKEYKARKADDRSWLTFNDYEKKYPVNEDVEKAMLLEKAHSEVQVDSNKNLTPPSQWQHLIFILKALYYSVVKPLPDHFSHQLFSLFVARPLILLAAPFFIITSVALELTNVLNAAIISMVPLMEGAIKGILLAVLNTPLFAFDSLNLGINKLNASYRKGKPGEPTLDIPVSSYSNMPFIKDNPQEVTNHGEQGSYRALYSPIIQPLETRVVEQEQSTLNTNARLQ